MGDLIVRGIPEDLRESLASRADRAGHSVSDEVISILQHELGQVAVATNSAEKMSAWAALRSIMVADSEEEAAIYAEIMEEIEAERKHDFGRPVEDLE